MDKPKLVFLIFCLLVQFSFGQDSTLSKQKVITKLKTFLTSRPLEKAYLQFDKPYYAAGDTIYFKAYVTAGEVHQLSNISGVLYVELINPIDKIDQYHTLQLKKGIAWGDFTLPDSLPAGNYRVRAYTQWMGNADNNSFFIQTIPIVSDINEKAFSNNAKTTANFKAADIQFFPEGGKLINGVRSKVAFKALANNGTGVGITGVVVDDSGKQVCDFSSIHLGMGYFYLTPEAGRHYSAKLNYGGSVNFVKLPAAEVAGINLMVDNDSLPVASVSITANKPYFDIHKNEIFKVLIYSGGSATTVNCKLDSMQLQFDIIKRRLHTGIATVTLISEANQPIAERIFFVQNYDQLKMLIKSEKITYRPREKIAINLEAKTRADSAAVGHFSVAVTNETKVPVIEDEQQTILTELLLTSDLRGTVEQPGYYFRTLNAETLQNLDLLMLTQGYRHFILKKIIDNTYPPISYQPQKGLEISGSATTFGGKPIANGSVSLISQSSEHLLTTITDTKGTFHFNGLNFTGTAEFILQANSAKGSKAVRIVYNKQTEPPLTRIASNEFNIPQRSKVYLSNYKKQLNAYNKNLLNKVITLKAVTIKEQREKNNYRSSVPGGAGHADQVIKMAELPQMGGNFTDRLNGLLHGVTLFRGSAYDGLNNSSNSEMLVVVDGVAEPTPPPYDLNSINPENVETVEVLKYASASIYGMLGGHGVIVITTKTGKQQDAKRYPIGRGFANKRAGILHSQGILRSEI